MASRNPHKCLYKDYGLMIKTTFPKKHFGQHFLRDQQVIQHIIQVIDIQPADHLVEIGPGLGALTTSLLSLVTSLDVIELDRDLIPKLRNLCEKASGKLNIYQADVLKFDFATLISTPSPLRIVGNLPYNISTPLLFHIIKNINIIKDMHFMLQLEVAQRLAAAPGSKDYGRLSVMVQYYCNVDLLFQVAPQSFYPAPAVDSAFVRLTPFVPNKRKFTAQNIDVFSNVVRAAFAQRRKTIHNNLKQIISADTLDAELRKLNIDPASRAEELTVEKFVQISNVLSYEL